MDYNEIKEQVKNRLTPKRYNHTLGVIETALHLCDKYGGDPAKARTAALLHDCAKYMTRDDCVTYGIDVSGMPDELIHAPLSAAIAEKDFGVTDSDILNAVRYHTTGRAGMSTLEKIVFIADAIEPSRDYPEVGMLRQLSEESLDGAVYEYLVQMEPYLNSKGSTMDANSIEARNELKNLIGGNQMENNTKTLATRICKCLDDKKGIDIKLINVSSLTIVADYMIIATGRSTTQVKAMCQEVEEKLEKESDIKPLRIEGYSEGRWIVMDYGSSLVHIFNDEDRTFYQLEQLWGTEDNVEKYIPESFEGK